MFAPPAPSPSLRPAAALRAPASLAPAPLAGNGLLGVRFGAPAAKIERAVTSYVGGLGPHDAATPAERACGVDRQLSWPGLSIDLFRGRFVGDELGPARGSGRLADLATAHGLRLGASTTTARSLYGAAFHTSWAQDGSFSIRTGSGTIAGFLSGAGPQGRPDPSGTIATLGAGLEGCPAMEP